METVLRVTVVYLFLMVSLRTMGKRDIGQLAPYDLVILLLIPELVAQGLIREDFSLTNSIVAVSTLLSLVFVTSVISHKSHRASRAIEGVPTILVRHGFLIPETMNRERISPDELFAQLHRSGLEQMSQVKWGILETDGSISFIPWEQGSQSGSEDRNRVF
jgi:uncharacterized membrane protein YcaP (DUF421 family)